MSTCISKQGEYGEHVFGDDPEMEFVCTRCFVLDEDALKSALTSARAVIIEAGLETYTPDGSEIVASQLIQQRQRIVELEAELARANRAARTLGGIVDRQVTDLLHWAGMDDQIGEDDPDQQTAWERVADMPGRIAELEQQVKAARAEALLDAAAAWQQGEWAYAPRRSDRAAERIANGNFVGAWLRGRAADEEAGS